MLYASASDMWGMHRLFHLTHLKSCCYFLFHIYNSSTLAASNNSKSYDERKTDCGSNSADQTASSTWRKWTDHVSGWKPVMRLNTGPDSKCRPSISFHGCWLFYCVPPAICFCSRHQHLQFAQWKYCCHITNLSSQTNYIPANYYFVFTWAIMGFFCAPIFVGSECG